MTDYETLKSLLTKWRVKFRSKPRRADRRTVGHTVTVERGYSGFSTSFTFDEAGAFVDMGAYEG